MILLKDRKNVDSKKKNKNIIKVENEISSSPTIGKENENSKTSFFFFFQNNI